MVNSIVLLGDQNTGKFNMNITVDGVKIEFNAEGVETFKDLLALVEGQYVLPPKVVTRIILNEEELDEAQEIGLGAQPVSGIASLELHSENRVDLAIESLEDAQAYQPELSGILEGAARSIREGNVNHGVQIASEALGYISAFGEILNGLRAAFQIDYSLVRIDDYTLLDKLLELNGFAATILKAIENEDWILFADLIEYEISPMMYQWMAVIPELVKMFPESDNVPEA